MTATQSTRLAALAPTLSKFEDYHLDPRTDEVWVKVSEEWWEVFGLDCQPEWIASYYQEEK
jgi:hypothetical protein